MTLSRQPAATAPSTLAAPSSSLDSGDSAIDLSSLSPADGEDLALETLIINRLEDDKAQDIVCIDLRGKSSMADTLIIASGRSHRHVGALADHVLRALKDAGHGKAKIEGLPACDWVLIDVGDVVVHLFRPEVRAFYNIEKIWSVSATGTGHTVSTN
ncbi:MAG: ribosome silencing factor [Asticcacaulis sp. 32-58-5]|nr:MAG: ribosome silencing factor [Asticcacaulis sp. 32-58-5]